MGPAKPKISIPSATNAIFQIAGKFLSHASTASNFCHKKIVKSVRRPTTRPIAAPIAAPNGPPTKKPIPAPVATAPSVVPRALSQVIPSMIASTNPQITDITPPIIAITGSATGAMVAIAADSLGNATPNVAINPPSFARDMNAPSHPTNFVIIGPTLLIALTAEEIALIALATVIMDFQVRNAAPIAPTTTRISSKLVFKKSDQLLISPVIPNHSFMLSTISSTLLSANPSRMLYSGNSKLNPFKVSSISLSVLGLIMLSSSNPSRYDLSFFASSFPFSIFSLISSVFVTTLFVLSSNSFGS